MFTPYFRLFILCVAILSSTSVSAFHYLEHSFFSDYACHIAQKKMLENGPISSKKLAARYVALSLYCPLNWNKPYCHNGYKIVESKASQLNGEVEDTNEISFTFGDLSALADHIHEFGPVKNIPRASQEGLMLPVMEWLSFEDGEPGGVFTDVAEDACELNDPVDWPKLYKVLEKDIAQKIRPSTDQVIPAEYLGSSRRTQAPDGTFEPAGSYSFDNPMYLDLVLRNHTHFGERSFATWVGYHSAATQIAESSCADVAMMDDDFFEDLSEKLSLHEDLDWDDEANRRKYGCKLLAQAMKKRIMSWVRQAKSKYVTPVKKVLKKMDEEFLDQAVVAYMSLVFEGGGLHYLQDLFAGGHIRTDRGSASLGKLRNMHDSNNKNGIVASLSTQKGISTFLAYGDAHLLAPPAEKKSWLSSCKWSEGEKFSDRHVTDCLLRHQRSLIIGSSSASLLDWYRGGFSFKSESQALKCDQSQGIDTFLCDFLPTRPVREANLAQHARLPLNPGSLPVPVSPFEYESLSTFGGINSTGDIRYVGTRLKLLSQLGAWATWLTSYNLGIGYGGNSAGSRDLALEFSYLFHWRWAARFLIDLGPGVQYEKGTVGEVIFKAPIGFTALPEGWTTIPIEISLNYNINILDVTKDDTSIFPGARKNWVEFSLGLAFM